MDFSTLLLVDAQVISEQAATKILSLMSLFFSECNCGIGSTNQSCSDDGSCYCLPGSTGIKCDECLPFHSTLSSSGCQPCSGCEHSLTLQLFAAEDSISAIRFNLSSFLALMSQDLAVNLLINSTVYAQFVRRLRSSEIFNVIEADLEALNGSTLNMLLMNSLSTEQQVWGNVFFVTAIYHYLSQQVLMALTRVVMMQPPARAAQINLFEISNAMQEVFIDAGNVDMFVAEISNALSSQVIVARDIRVNVSTISRHGTLNFSTVLHQRIVESIREVQSSLSDLLLVTEMQQTQTSIAGEKYSNVNLTEKLLLLYSIEHTLLSYLEGQCNITSNLSIGLSPLIEYFQYLYSEALLSLAETEKNIARAEMLLLCAGEDIEALAEISGSSPLSEESTGSGVSGSGEQMSSGSGEESGILLRSGGGGTAIAEQIVVLKNSTNQLVRQLLLGEVDLYVSENVTRLVQDSQAINK